MSEYASYRRDEQGRNESLSFKGRKLKKVTAALALTAAALTSGCAKGALDVDTPDFPAGGVSYTKAPQEGSIIPGVTDVRKAVEAAKDFYKRNILVLYSDTEQSRNSEVVAQQLDGMVDQAIDIVAQAEASRPDTVKKEVLIDDDYATLMEVTVTLPAGPDGQVKKLSVTYASAKKDGKGNVVETGKLEKSTVSSVYIIIQLPMGGLREQKKVININGFSCTVDTSPGLAKATKKEYKLHIEALDASQKKTQEELNLSVNKVTVDAYIAELGEWLWQMGDDMSRISNFVYFQPLQRDERQTVVGSSLSQPPKSAHTGVGIKKNKGE